MITFVIDLNPYESLLNKLNNELRQLDAARLRVGQDYSREKGYLRLLHSLGSEATMIEAQWKDMKNYLKEIELLQAREKRSVVPIVGKALNVLFGTVTEDDVKFVRRKLGEVEISQRTLAQVAKGECVNIKCDKAGSSQE